jgi:hypothetical protein
MIKHKVLGVYQILLGILVILSDFLLYYNLWVTIEGVYSPLIIFSAFLLIGAFIMFRGVDSIKSIS